MAPTYSNGQEMVSIYLIKIKITTKFFKFEIYIVYFQALLAIVLLEVFKFHVSKKMRTENIVTINFKLYIEFCIDISVLGLNLVVSYVQQKKKR